MESIEEQWNHPLPPDVTSDSWIDIANAKSAVKTWILDRAESWAILSQQQETSSAPLPF